MRHPDPVIAFAPDGFVTARPDLMGRHAAGEGFLQGLIRHGDLATLHGYLLDTRHEEEFGRVGARLGATMPLAAIPPHRLDQVAALGTLVLPDPSLAEAARLRSFLGPGAYSVVGVTHTTASAAAMRMLAELPTAPVQTWDALVCTSRAVAAMAGSVVQAEEAALAERLGATRFVRPLLPVIPLGVDAAALAPRPDWREAWRAKLGIGTGEVAVLYLGRISRHGKAHPLPMFAALGRAARRVPPRLHLILAGWWIDPAEEPQWREQAAALCPEVRLHMLDGRQKEVRQQIRSAADIFTLLADNIQETYGLAPVEAMAAGLPVVVTDWNGFRDTVRHNVDGMLVPTMMGPPCEALELAQRFATGELGYGNLMAGTGRLTAVDIAAATDAYVALASDAGLRRRMGTAGQERARSIFDWAAVIPQHRALWQELRAIRLTAPEPAARPGFLLPDARHMDPTQAFAAWPSRTFRLSQRLRAATSPGSADLPSLIRFTNPPLAGDLDEAGLGGLLAALRERGEATARELVEGLEPAQRLAARRGLLWLLRVGLAVAA